MKKRVLFIVLTAIYVVFIAVSLIINYEPGRIIGTNFMLYSIEMIKVLPFAFILIGLFEVWVKRETVEKHLGENSGFICYLWAVLLGGLIIGPMLVALPVAYSLYKKGARLSVIFSYVGAAAVCRIPMTIFEASYLGIKFTVIRYAVSIPLIILSSILLEKYLNKKNYKILNGKK
jgi:uncharacterized membrane protein YraQ (UPF0718 family)